MYYYLNFIFRSEEKIKNEGKEVFHNILFDFGSDKLTEESYAVLETLSEYLKANKDHAYYIVGTQTMWIHFQQIKFSQKKGQKR